MLSRGWVPSMSALGADPAAVSRAALALCAGVSVKYGYDMNSLAVPRRAKEAIGGIAALRKPDDATLTINVEYNLLDPLLRASGWADGDVNDDSGYSPYPGAASLMCCKSSSQHPKVLCTLYRCTLARGI